MTRPFGSHVFGGFALELAVSDQAQQEQPDLEVRQARAGDAFSGAVARGRSMPGKLSRMDAVSSTSSSIFGTRPERRSSTVPEPGGLELRAHNLPYQHERNLEKVIDARQRDQSSAQWGFHSDINRVSPVDLHSPRLTNSARVGPRSEAGYLVRKHTYSNSVDHRESRLHSRDPDS